MAVHFLRPLFGRPGRWSVHSRTCLVPRLLSQRNSFILLPGTRLQNGWRRSEGVDTRPHLCTDGRDRKWAVLPVPVQCPLTNGGFGKAVLSVPKTLRWIRVYD